MGDLSNNQLRFKVDVNARENHMTGASLVLPPGAQLADGAAGFSLVIVEGSPKTLRRWASAAQHRAAQHSTASTAQHSTERPGCAVPCRPTRQWPCVCLLLLLTAAFRTPFNCCFCHCLLHPTQLLLLPPPLPLAQV